MTDELDDVRTIAELMAEYRVSRNLAIDMLAFRRYGGDLDVDPPMAETEPEEGGHGRALPRQHPAPARR